MTDRCQKLLARQIESYGLAVAIRRQQMEILGFISAAARCPFRGQEEMKRSAIMIPYKYLSVRRLPLDSVCPIRPCSDPSKNVYWCAQGARRRQYMTLNYSKGIEALVLVPLYLAISIV